MGQPAWQGRRMGGKAPAMPPPATLPRLFLLLALPVLLFLSLHVPTGEIPDEVAHVARMDSLLHGDVLGRRGTTKDGLGNAVPDSGLHANPGLLAAGFAFDLGAPLAQRVMTRERQAYLEAVPWAPTPVFVSSPNTAVYSPLLYVPGAVAIQAARWLGYGPWHAILAARLANAAAYLAAGAVALRLARRLRGLLFATLLLPTSLWMAASCNQDGLVIAVSALAAALLTRAAMPAWWAAAAATAALAMAKPPYVPLAGVVAILLPRRGALPTRAAGALLAMLPAVSWHLAANRFVAAPFIRGVPFQAGPYWPGDPDQVFGTVDPALQLEVFLRQPALLLRLPLEYVGNHGGWLLWGVVGILGTLDVFLPAALYALWLSALAALLVGESLAGRTDPPSSGPLACLLALACALAAALAVFDIQYLSWTLTGASEIEGIQGRYFIPLLPFLGLALPTFRVPRGTVLRGALRAPAVLAGFAGLAVIPALVLATYYLR